VSGFCFCCGEELELIHESSPALYAATRFYATGNYGSGVFDPQDRRLSLRIDVCDGCMKLRSDRAVQVLTVRPPVVQEFSAWDPAIPQ
jgi:hypothetical protein